MGKRCGTARSRIRFVTGIFELNEKLGIHPLMMDNYWIHLDT